MKKAARDYQDRAIGARYNRVTRKSHVPALAWTGPEGKENLVRFDSLDGDVLIDRKHGVATTEHLGRKALRQSEAVAYSNYRCRWEVPNKNQARRAKRLFDKYGISNISVEIVP
jgi:hypothetical protein